MDGSALIFCEGALGTPTGKTANGLARHTDRYEVLGIIDSRCAEKSARDVVVGVQKDIPVFASLDGALEALFQKPDYLVIGLAPDGGMLPESYRPAVEDALRRGINVDAGLHGFLSEDPGFAQAAREGEASIRDVRRCPPRENLHFWTGKIGEVTAFKVAVLGTDSAVGKRATAQLLKSQLEKRGASCALVGTGQTAWFQGVPHGILMDAVINDFVAGELEHAVWSAWRDLEPEFIVIEGQGCLTHPAYPGGFEILGACRPDAIVVQHAPKRRDFDGFPGIPVAGLEKELAVLKALDRAPVIALTLNQEDMTREEVEACVRDYEDRYEIPAVAPFIHGCEKIAAALS